MGSRDLRALFDRHHLEIYRFLQRMTGDEDAAEELTQEVFLRLARRGRGFGAQEQPRGWLFAVARNLARDRARGSRRRALGVEPVPLPVAPPQVLQVALRQALGRLPEEDREVFLLRELGGLGYREMARLTGRTPDAVRSRIHRARTALRRVLERPLGRARRGLAADKDKEVRSHES